MPIPFLWAFATPVFAATASAIISAQGFTGIPWFTFIVLCGWGVRLALAPLMIRQMVLINKMSHASPSIRLAAKLFKHSKLALPSRVYNSLRAMIDFAQQTKTSLMKFYFYNIIQIPVFIVMVLSIRKVCYENSDLAGAGFGWFVNLNQPDPYFILPLLATALNYANLGVSTPPLFSQFSLSSSVLPRTTNTGSLTASAPSSKSSSFSICPSPTSGLQVLSSTGFPPRCSSSGSNVSLAPSGSSTKLIPTFSMTTKRCTRSGQPLTTKTT